MGYVDVQSLHNPTTGTSPPASWGDGIRDDLEWLARNLPHCRVYNNAAQSISNAAETALTFNSERYDVGGCHSTGSNTSRLTVPSGGDGVYGIFGHVGWALNGTGVRAVIIRLNGATHIARSRKGADNNGDECAIYTEYALVAGDYVELTVYQTSGGALNTAAGGNYSPEFGMRWVCL